MDTYYSILHKISNKFRKKNAFNKMVCPFLMSFTSKKIEKNKIKT